MGDLPFLRRPWNGSTFCSSVRERDLCLTKGFDRRREDGEGVSTKINTSLWSDWWRTLPAMSSKCLAVVFFHGALSLHYAPDCFMMSVVQSMFFCFVCGLPQIRAKLKLLILDFTNLPRLSRYRLIYMQNMTWLIWFCCYVCSTYPWWFNWVPSTTQQ